MKKFTFLFAVFLSLNLSAQFSNVLLPEKAKTSADDGSNDNFYIGSVDYEFATQEEFEAITFVQIRIRPIVDGAADPDVDFVQIGLLGAFQTYVAENGLTGTFSFSAKMPTDSQLPSTAARVAEKGETAGYDARFQARDFFPGFNPLEVFESSAEVCEARGGVLTGGPFNFIVGDGQADTIPAGAITLAGNLGTNSQWVVTDEQGIILGLPASPSDVNFDTAPSGVCLIWHLSFEDGLGGAAVDSSANNLTGCFSLSNSITVERRSVDDPVEMFSEIVLPEQVTTSANDGSDDQFYVSSVTYNFSTQEEVDALTFMAIRIRPITQPFTKDPDVPNTDLGLLTAFKTYVADNGLSGVFPINLTMPVDSLLPSTVARMETAGETAGYDTRFQTNGFLTPFTPLEVIPFESEGGNDGTITWEAKPLEGEEDVLTEGELKEAINFESGLDASIHDATVNGVPFKGAVSGAENNSWPNPTTNCFSANSGNVVPPAVDNYDPAVGLAVFDQLLSGFIWDAGDASDVTISNLEVGKDYKIQLLMGDTRASQDGAYIVMDGSFGSLETTSYTVSNGLSIIGSFTAISNTVSFTIDKVFSGVEGNMNLNAYQIRDVTSIIDNTYDFELERGINIAPNPTRDWIMIESVEALNNARILLFSLDGRLVRQDIFADTSKVINVSDLDAGMYLLRIVNDGKVATKKLLIKD
ncbi:MAG: T9SS type A sorting domain-containing protein [Bacteroidota bacterium]